MATSLGQFPLVNGLLLLEEDQDRLGLRTADSGMILRSLALDIEILCTAGTTGYPSTDITGLGHIGLGYPGQCHLGQSRLCEDHLDQMGLDAKKPVFGVSDKMKFKPVSSATKTS